MMDGFRSTRSGGDAPQTALPGAGDSEGSLQNDRMAAISSSEALRGKVLIVDESTQAAEVQDALDAGKLVCVREVSARLTDKLHERLACREAQLAEATGVLFYGVQKMAHGWARFVEYQARLDVREDVPMPSQAVTAEHRTETAEHQTATAELPGGFAGWLVRTTAGRPRHLLGQPNSIDLFQMAESFTDNIYAELPITTRLGDTGKTLSLQASIFAVACNVSGTEGADYYCVQMQCLFSPAAGLSTRSGFWMLGYNAKIAPTDFGNQMQLLTLISSSPDTTQGEISTSSSTSTTVGGNIGFFGSTMTGGMQGSVTFGTSHSFSTPGVVTSNQSGGSAQGAAWTFAIKPESPVAVSSFQPFVQGLWRVSSSEAAKLASYEKLRLNIDLQGIALDQLCQGTVTVPTHVTAVKRPPTYRQNT